MSLCRASKSHYIILVLIQLAFASVSVAEDEIPAPTLTPVDFKSCVFADQETIVQYTFPGKANLGKTATWKLTAADRVVAHGSQGIKDASGAFSVTLRGPPLNPGLTVSTKLEVACEIEDGRPLICTSTLEVFSADAFSDRGEAIRALNLQLYDPLGTTARAFRESDIPFTARRTLAAVDAIESGVLFFGEGLDWSKQPVVAQAAVRAAQRGLIVVCLAPTAGEMKLAGDEPHSPVVPLKIEVGEDPLARWFGRKTETRSWTEKKGALTKFLVESKGSNRVAQVSRTDKGQLWIEAIYQASRADRPRGKLTLCGYKIIDSWQSSPLPRYVLRQILESCSETAPPTK